MADYDKSNAKIVDDMETVDLYPELKKETDSFVPVTKNSCWPLSYLLKFFSC
jgi:hypothetical protein